MNANKLVAAAVLTACAWAGAAFAQQKSITLPKGTAVQKLAPGHFKFKLPNKQVVEVRNFNPKTGTAGMVSIIDPQPPGKGASGKTKVIDADPPYKPVTGKQVALRTSKKLTKADTKKLKPADFVMIDDEVTWLPAVIAFQPNALGDPDPPPAARTKIAPQRQFGDPDPPMRGTGNRNTRGLSPQSDPSGKK